MLLKTWNVSLVIDCRVCCFGSPRQKTCWVLWIILEQGCSSAGWGRGLAWRWWCIVLMQVWLPHVAGDFSPTVDFQRRLSDGVCAHPMCYCMHQHLQACSNPKHWRPYCCLDSWKNNTLKANPWRWNVTAQAAGELKMVTYTVCFLKNGCTAVVKRGMQEEGKNEGKLITRPWNVPFLRFDVSPL